MIFGVGTGIELLLLCWAGAENKPQTAPGMIIDYIFGNLTVLYGFKQRVGKAVRRSGHDNIQATRSAAFPVMSSAPV